MKKYGEPTPEALVESALRHVEILYRMNFLDFKVSVKASEIFMAVQAYKLLAEGNRSTLASGDYRSRWFTFRHGEIGHRYRHVAV